MLTDQVFINEFICTNNYFLVAQILGNFKKHGKPTSEISQPILTTTMCWQTSVNFGNVSTTCLQSYICFLWLNVLKRLLMSNTYILPNYSNLCPPKTPFVSPFSAFPLPVTQYRWQGWAGRAGLQLEEERKFQFVKLISEYSDVFLICIN